MNGDQIGGIIRAVVAAVGGYFVGKSVVDGGTVTTIAGALATLATAIVLAILANLAAPATSVEACFALVSGPKERPQRGGGLGPQFTHEVPEGDRRHESDVDFCIRRSH